MNDLKRFFLSLLLVALAASTGTIFGPDEFYAVLLKPPGTPSPALFPIVWTILYFLMALSLTMILKVSAPRRKLLLFFFFSQLFFNALWSPLFFGFKLPLLAAFDIALLLSSLGLYIGFCFKDKSTEIAGMILGPYFVWAAYAFYLNIGIIILNF